MSRETQNAILAIGGAEDKVHGKEILHTFIERSGGREAHVGIIPCASRDPVTIANRYRKIFTEMGVSDMEVMDIRDRSQGKTPCGKPSWKNARACL
jgi:cyanophycinase